MNRLEIHTLTSKKERIPPISELVLLIKFDTPTTGPLRNVPIVCGNTLGAGKLLNSPLIIYLLIELEVSCLLLKKVARRTQRALFREGFETSFFYINLMECNEG